jgi:phenylpropionate dioxygenase-like ring-hydroxylating dioxygenase large terminal subunit
MAIPTTLPASWYCSPGLHQLERRAVFLRSWFFLGTVNKFQIGESARFEIAQIELTAVATSNGSAKVVKVFDGSSVCRRKFQNTCHSSTD